MAGEVDLLRMAEVGGGGKEYQKSGWRLVLGNMWRVLSGRYVDSRLDGCIMALADQVDDAAIPVSCPGSYSGYAIQWLNISFRRSYPRTRHRLAQSTAHYPPIPTRSHQILSISHSSRLRPTQFFLVIGQRPTRFVSFDPLASRSCHRVVVTPST